MKKMNLQKYKLRIRMAVTNTLLAVIPLFVFSVVLYNVFVRDSNRLIVNSLTATFEQMSDRLDEYFTTVHTLNEVFSQNETVQSVLSKGGDLSQTDAVALEKQLENVLLLNPTIRAGYVITQNETVVATDDAPDSNFVWELLEKDEVNNPKGAFLSVTDNHTQKQIAAVQNITDKQSGNSVGYVVLLVDRERLIRIFDTDIFGESMRFLMLDSAGNIVFQPEKNEKIPVLTMYEKMPKDADIYVNSLSFNGEDYQYVIKTTAETDWKVVVMVSERELYQNSFEIGYHILLFISIVLILCVMLSTATNFRITRPITRLTEAIDRVASGDFKHKIAFSEKNEITMIADNFNHMVDEVQGLTKKIFLTQQRLYETELERKQFEVSLLQSQINSHFLYNTLACIRAMSRKGAEKEVSVMISSLVNMLRYASDIQEKSVLQDEFINIKNYVSIQRMRLGKQLRLLFGENDDIIDCEVPKMILQPVVENSILHGFDSKDSDWIVRVTAKKKGDCVYIRIADNGSGMPEDTLAALNKSLTEKKSIFNTTKAKKSIGLVNIQNRIRSLYGQEFGLRVRSWQGLGTVVVMQIPYKKSDDYVFRTFD